MKQISRSSIERKHVINHSSSLEKLAHSSFVKIQPCSGFETSQYLPEIRSRSIIAYAYKCYHPTMLGNKN